MRTQGDSDTSTGLVELVNLLSGIEATSERLAQNEWMSVGRNGSIDFYY